ncbi:uncharacterized protein LOC122289304 [Carya illinoinensis]|uniref:uncharacterized protein LOC122289304 n=1 Tax=Carya illinoinensis TaxID=32201 RepID=UPI001C72527C|nr:uncharacterized protein LOC122289304 [Carya illinoinensis]
MTLWLKEDDKCTKFFHKVANSHQRNNTIESVYSGTQVLSSTDDLENHIVQYFENLLSEPVGLRPKLDGLPFKSINSQSANGLERAFEEDKVVKLIRSMTKDKAPGPDGFLMGVPGILCKLDMEKAYDYVNWDSLFYLLGRCDFGDKWISWIRYCISIVRFSVLVNGTHVGFFNISCGLRQGDPLSHFLFVIVMEVLGRLVKAAIGGGFLFGFSVGNGTNGPTSFSHLLFTDDTLLFYDADPGQIQSL